MQCIDYVLLQAEHLRFKTVVDSKSDEYVLLNESAIDSIDYDINDKTAFEAIENHIHIIDRLSKVDYAGIAPVMKQIGSVLLANLRLHFPNKEFVVFVTAKPNDSLIVRFHQKWKDELPYYTLEGWDPTEDIVMQFST